MTVYVGTQDTKLCNKCEQIKPVSDFYVHKAGKQTGTVFNWCKQCCTDYNHGHKPLKRKSLRRKMTELPSDIKTKTRLGKRKTFLPENMLDLCKNTIKVLFGKGQIEKIDDEFNVAYQKAMKELEKILTRSLVAQSVGFYLQEEKVTYVKSTIDAGWVSAERQVIKKWQPGNATLFTLLLTNKFPDRWKVSRELLTGQAETYDSKPSQRSRKSIESLARDVLEQNTDRPEAEHSVSDGLAQLPVGSDKDGQK